MTWCRYADTAILTTVARSDVIVASVSNSKSVCVEAMLERASRRKVVCGGLSTYFEYYVVTTDREHGE